MKILSEFIKEKKIKCFLVKTNKETYILGKILKKLNINKFEISTTSLEHKNCIDINSTILKKAYRDILIGIYLIYKINRTPLKITVGIDPGLNNTGLVILAGNILIYAENIHEYEEIPNILETISELNVKNLIVKIGLTSSTLFISKKIKEKTEKKLSRKKHISLRILFIEEDKIKEHVIRPYIDKIKKNPHIFSALKIALWQSWRDYIE